MQPNTLNPELRQIMDHANEDYPVGVYYVEPYKMYMNYVRWHWHEELEINLVKNGTAEFTIGDEKIILNEGQGIFLNKNVLHAIRSVNGDDCILLSLIFNPVIMFHNENCATAQSYLNTVVENSAMRYMIFDRKDMWGRSALAYLSDIFEAYFSQDFGYELATKSSLCQLWLLFFKKCNPKVIPDSSKEKKNTTLSPDEIRIKDAILFIQNHYAELISLDDIAASIHVSKSECCRCFKRAVNLTPFEYLMRYRILQAADKILQHDRNTTSISELAISVGFNNTSYFNKLFKKYFNCTPTEYRKLSKTEHRDQLSHFGLSLTHI